MKKTIKEMSIGEKGIVTDLQFENKTKSRFLDLGIAPMAEIELIKKINFDHLYIIEVDDVEICIRKKDAKSIVVNIQ